MTTRQKGPTKVKNKLQKMRKEDPRNIKRRDENHTRAIGTTRTLTYSFKKTVKYTENIAFSNTPFIVHIKIQSATKTIGNSFSSFLPRIKKRRKEEF